MVFAISLIENRRIRGENMKKEKKVQTQCEYCSNYIYDEEFGYFLCDVNLDEDEMSHFLRDSVYHCPYFQMNDEYKIVRKQM